MCAFHPNINLRSDNPLLNPCRRSQMTDDQTVKNVQLAELKIAVGAKGKVVIEAYDYHADNTVNVDSSASKKVGELGPVCTALNVLIVELDEKKTEK